MKIMKNVYILTTFDPRWSGWVEKVMNELWNALNNTWRYNVIYVFSWKNSSKSTENWITYNSIKTPQVPGLPFFSLILKLFKILKNCWKNDIVVDNSWYSYLYLLLHKKIFKLVYVVHWTMRWSTDSIKYRWQGYINKVISFLYSKLCDCIYWYTVKKSDLVITLSKYLVQEIVNYYQIETFKIRVIYNWCDFNNELYSHKNSKLKVLFIWNDSVRKWLTILDEVATKMLNEDIEFYLIWCRAEKSDVKNIIPMGSMKRDDLYKFMSNADVIFLPSRYEWQPLVLFEAMSFWCIPVFSKFCHMDMLEDTDFKKFINDTNSSEKYVEIFNELINMKDLNDLRKLAQDSVKNYTWDKQMIEYVKTFDWI